jgi:capsular exopolysaccharide synthesis family protein
VEAYRGIRTNLLFAAIDEPPRTLLVTSSVPGEGKTHTASNLAVVMAQAGRRVILVDADFRRPRLPALFGRIDARGATNLLIDGSDPAELLWQTEVPNLRLLCSGPLPLNPSEIIGSRRMQQLIGYLREISDLVLFDSSPINAVTDAAILATRVDGCIVVVHAGRTSRTLLQQAVGTLRQVGARTLGVVLNQVKDGSELRYSEYYHAYADERRQTEPSRENARIASPSSRGAAPESEKVATPR